jgi:hypothetical protein
MRFKLAFSLITLSLAFNSTVSAGSEQQVASLSSSNDAAFTQISLQSLQPHSMSVGAQNTAMNGAAIFAPASTDTLESTEPSRWLMMLVGLLLVSYQLRRKHRSLKLQHIAGF